MDNLTDKVETAIQDGKAREARLREVEREQTRLKTIVGVWNSINTLGVIAATAFKGYINGE